MKNIKTLILIITLFIANQSWAACNGNDIRAKLENTLLDEINSRAMAEKFAQGNFWRAERGSQVLHILGTIHIYDPRLDNIFATIRPTLEEAEIIYLEATNKELEQLETTMAQNTDLYLIESGPTLLEILTQEQWQRVSEHANSMGIPPFMATKMEPWFLSISLSIPQCAMNDLMNGANGLDNMINNWAEQNGAKAVALEPFDTLFSSFHQFDLDKQIELFIDDIPPIDQVEDMLSTTLNAYFEQNTAQIWHLDRTLAALRNPEKDHTLDTDLQDILLNNRNEKWGEILEMDPHTNIFVGVGAAHLFGEHGILSLLKKQGYRITRLSL